MVRTLSHPRPLRAPAPSVLPSDCLTAVRTSHAFGADLDDGASTEFYAEEWQTMLRAVADALGGCPPRR